MQLFNVPRAAPPPDPEAILPTTLQLYSLHKYVPPPEVAELSCSTQLYSDPEMAPPPQKKAVLPINTQFEMTELENSQ
jgi:hypothetical protein